MEYSISSKPIDDRRNRRYGRSVEMVFRGEEIPETVYGPVNRALREETRELPVRVEDVRHFGRSQRAGVSGSTTPPTLIVRLFYPASRPSEIFSEEQVAELSEAYRETIERAILVAQARAAERARREKVCREVQRTVSHLADSATERAREIVRFPQRLAALRAELEAEVSTQVEKAIAGVKAPDDFEPESLDLATKLLRERAPRAATRSNHFMDDPFMVSVGDLFPEGE